MIFFAVLQVIYYSNCFQSIPEFNENLKMLQFFPYNKLKKLKDFLLFNGKFQQK